MNVQTSDKPFRGKVTANALTEHYGRVEPLIGDDEAIRNAVNQAELPPLLATLSVLLEDPSLISDDLMPPTPPLLAAAAPHGGMSEAAQQKARALATGALIKLRDRGLTDRPLNAESMKAALKFITKNGSDDNLPLLLAEFGHPIDIREPHWTKSDLAPDRDFKVIVVGGGLSGIAAAYRLAQAEIPFIVFEKGTEVGGVWWNNSYPGCRLDTPNYAYSFSFAPKADWPQLFSQRGEIFAYLKNVVDTADLRQHFRLSSEVLSMQFDATEGLWTVAVLQDGRVTEYRANAIIAACGNLNRPRIPEIEGQHNFRGAAFHSSEWRHDVDVTGKRVAVVGTGASAFQIVPSIAEKVASLAVFQRTPPWMLPTPSYHKDMAAGMLWLLARVPTYGRWYRLWQFWLSSLGRMPAVTVDPNWKHPVSVSDLNERLRQESLAGLVQNAGDRKDLIEKLTPDYPPGTKRMMRDNGSYLKALCRPNVSLETDGIARLTESGILTKSGTHHDIDVIVYATGFKAAEILSPIEITGPDGRTLSEHWADESRAYMGITVPGFPNLFIVGGPNGHKVINGNSVNTAEFVVHYALDAFRYMLENSVRSVDVRLDVHDELNATVDEANALRVWGKKGVTTWYQGKSGRPTLPWPFSMFEYAFRTTTFKPDEYHLHA
jgi:4-hydroxyacetophenone monooxygenase